jgi:hypothetical protein
MRTNLPSEAEIGVGGTCLLKMPSPSAMKAICASSSVVISTIVEAKARGAGTRCRTAVRAPSAMPPMCEKGRRSLAASRTILAQTKTPKYPFPPGSRTNHADARSGHIARPYKHSKPNPPKPVRATAETTVPNPM